MSDCNVDKSIWSPVIYNTIRIIAFIFSSQQDFYVNLPLI